MSAEELEALADRLEEWTTDEEALRRAAAVLRGVSALIEAGEELAAVHELECRRRPCPTDPKWRAAVEALR